jgi:hypothetical protein
LDADDGEKLCAVVGGSGDERNRNRHYDDDDDDDDNDKDNDVRRKMPAAATVGGSHPRTMGGGSRVMIPPLPPPTQTTRTTMRPPTGQSSSRAKDDTDAPHRAGGSLGARECPGGCGGRRDDDVGRLSLTNSSSSIEAELGHALIRDPLRLLQPRFLRHLCLEVANRYFASSSCLWASLVVIFAALGLALVATGLAGLGGPLARASSCAAASILAVAMSKLVWPVARSAKSSIYH